MGLNKSTGNMYEFITHTWNTIKGACPHGCSYCYMHRWGKQKPVRFDEKELRTDLDRDNFIFVGSSCDMWAERIPSQWINETLVKCMKYQNQYLFQSKNPIRFIEFKTVIPEGSILCTTIETNRVYHQQMGKTYAPESRAWAMDYFKGKKYRLFLTIEPIMDFDIKELTILAKIFNPEQINIGADSGNNHLPEPTADKILALIDELSKFTKVVQKPNLGRLLA
jgi:DNA repair photolyase